MFTGSQGYGYSSYTGDMRRILGTETADVMFVYAVGVCTRRIPHAEGGQGCY